jgi:hypothetical protein
LTAFETQRRVPTIAILVDELDAARWLYRNAHLKAVSASNREQKLGSFCEIRTLWTASCMLFYLILALHETADRAVFARCGPALIAVEAEEVGQRAADRFRCAHRLLRRHRRQRVDGTSWLCLV